MTLIELVIVIIVLAIISAIAAPRFVDIKADAESAAQAGTEGAMMSAYVIAVADALDTPTWTQYIAKISDMTCGAADGVCTSADFDGDTNDDLQYQFYTGGAGVTCLAGEVVAAGANIPSHYILGATNAAPVHGAATCTALF